MNKLTHDRLLELLHYDSESGIFTRRITTSSRSIAGQMAGSIKKDGRIRITLDSTEYLANRLAWFYVYGVWPSNYIDHEDGNPSNNRLDNLRDVSPAGNSQNKRKATASNKSGFLGVETEAKRNAFRAVITVNGKKKFIGRFKTPELAHAAYLDYKREFHPTCSI